MVMKILLFDIFITGHHSEYINHLVDYIIKNNDNSQYIFVVHPLFLQQFPDIHQKCLLNGNIGWITISQDEFNKCNRGGIGKKSLSTYWIMNKYALNNNVDHVVLLSINHFQLALGIFRSSYTISGILFKQFHRIPKGGNPIIYYRKYLQTLLLTFNKKITNIFILNDYSSVEYFNSQFKTSVFKVLPDPVPELKPLKGFDIYKEYNIIKRKKIFLHIGSLSERKGTFEIIYALSQIPSNIRKGIFVLLVGKVSDEIDDLINKKINDLNLNSNCYLDNSFVDNEKMKSLFLQSDVVLIPYKNSEASSGILGHAAASNIPVIGPNTGLLGELIREYNLGLTINKSNPICISEAIREYLNRPFVIERKSNHFTESHKPMHFSKIVLNIYNN